MDYLVVVSFSWNKVHLQTVNIKNFLMLFNV